jgi:hypothetical protein
MLVQATGFEPVPLSRLAPKASALTTRPNLLHVHRFVVTFAKRYFASIFSKHDNVAEWLRRQPAKLMGYARVGSNPTVVAFFFKSVETKQT